MDERKKNHQGGQCFYHKITFENEIRKTDISQDNLQQIDRTLQKLNLFVIFLINQVASAG